MGNGISDTDATNKKNKKQVQRRPIPLERY